MSRHPPVSGHLLLILALASLESQVMFWNRITEISTRSAFLAGTISNKSDNVQILQPDEGQVAPTELIHAVALTCSRLNLAIANGASWKHLECRP